MRAGGRVGCDISSVYTKASRPGFRHGQRFGSGLIGEQAARATPSRMPFPSKSSRRPFVPAVVAGVIASLLACGPQRMTTQAVPSTGGSLARVYYWRAKPGKLAEYTDYIQKLAEPIDHEAQRRGAFLSVTTYVSTDTSSTWTHMRVFILRDSAQLAGLSAALDAAGVAIEPDSAKRRGRGQYGATLRDAAGSATYRVLP